MRRRKNKGIVKALTEKKYSMSIASLVLVGVAVYYFYPQIKVQVDKVKAKDDKAGLGALGMKSNGAHMGAIGMGAVHKAGMHVNSGHMGALHLNPGHMGAIGLQGFGAIGME